ncbi:hypothetical protein Vafri_574, partial [Volvox africanus]
EAVEQVEAMAAHVETRQGVEVEDVMPALLTPAVAAAVAAGSDVAIAPAPTLGPGGPAEAYVVATAAAAAGTNPPTPLSDPATLAAPPPESIISAMEIVVESTLLAEAQELAAGTELLGVATAAEAPEAVRQPLLEALALPLHSRNLSALTAAAVAAASEGSTSSVLPQPPPPPLPLMASPCPAGAPRLSHTPLSKSLSGQLSLLAEGPELAPDVAVRRRRRHS